MEFNGNRSLNVTLKNIFITEKQQKSPEIWNTDILSAYDPTQMAGITFTGRIARYCHRPGKGYTLEHFFLLMKQRRREKNISAARNVAGSA
jgi:hypothetical protein